MTGCLWRLRRAVDVSAVPQDGRRAEPAALNAQVFGAWHNNLINLEIRSSIIGQRTTMAARSVPIRRCDPYLANLENGAAGSRIY
jgi:hypothetical protein